MSLNEILTLIFKLILIPISGALATFIAIWIKKKANEIANKTDSEILNKYLNLLADIVSNCVIMTQQTYVDSLKKQDKFDMDAQKQAFCDTYNAIIATLSEDAYAYLSEMVGDLDKLITSMIESTVYELKK